MGQSILLFVQRFRCRRSSAPHQSACSAQFKAALIKELCSDAADAAVLIKPLLCQNLAPRPQTGMKGHVSLDGFSSLRDKMILTRRRKRIPEKCVRGRIKEYSEHRQQRIGIMVRCFPSFPARGAEKRRLQSPPALAVGRTQTHDALADFYRSTSELLWVLLRKKETKKKKKQSRTVG